MYFNGTKCYAAALACILSLSLSAKDATSVNGAGLRKPLSFVENKGQVTDQDNNPRNDIQYKLSTPGMNLYIGSGQLHYQFKKVDGTPSSATATTSAYRMDVTLAGANPNAKIIATDEQAYYENYYLSQTGANGITAHSWNKITYKDVYPNIDWVVYVKDNKVEYDFVVRPGGNTADIKLQYDGATALSITPAGGICAKTPMGTIEEKNPVAFETATGKAIASNFKLHNNIITFETGNYNGSLTIDPYLSWATYFGGANEDVATGIAISGGNTFVSGFTSSTGLATSGVFQNTYGTGAFDAFVAKYNSAGVLQFASYFGGTGTDEGTSIAVDNAGAIYLAGYTTSSAAGLTTGGAYHVANNGGTDGFLIKFSATGTRQWCTFYGGALSDMVNGVTTDASANVYIIGQTFSTSLISSAGAYQTALSGASDAFVAKFNAAGAVQWSTYYGGAGTDEGLGISTDPSNSVIITGQTNSVINMASAGAFQASLSGTNDAFVAKFATGGTRTWGTYLGGTGADQGNSVAVNQTTGDIAIAGNTTSTAGFASTNVFQPTYGGGVQDAFVAYFSNSGTHAWSTYYGGTSLDYGQSVCFDAIGNVILAGGSFSSTGIASAGSYQPAIAGDYDAYFAKLNILGQRIWGTYFGGTLYDYANGVACDASNKITIAGYTTSSAGIATSGTSQTAYGGGTYDAFVAQFKTDTFVVINQPFTDTLICQGGTLTVPYTVYPTGATFQPGNIFTVQLSSATGSFAAPVAIGTVNAFTSGAVTCTVPLAASGTGYRIRIVASNPAATSPDDYYNIHIVPSIAATVASAVTPTCVGQTIYLFDTASYTVSGYSWAGPSGFASTLQNPTRPSAALTYAGTYTVTVSHNGCPASTSTADVVINSVIPPTPVPTAGVGCAGSPLSLFANPDTTATVKYAWVGPNSFTSTDQNPVIAGATTINTGYYFLSDTLNGCPSAQVFIHVTVQPIIPVSVHITATPGDTVCANTLVLFVATPVNGGTSTTYQWMIGSAPVVGAVSSTWSSSTLSTGDNVYCVMHSTVTCPSPINATSNVLTMQVVNSAPLVYIAASPSAHVASGSPVTFSSDVYDGGVGAMYQWSVDGAAVAGATSTTFTLPAVTESYTVSLTVTSTMLCALPGFGVSNTIVAETNVGVANVSAALTNIGLYPNPNNGSFTVKGEMSGLSSSPVALSITNILGQVIYTDNAAVTQSQLDKDVDVSHLPGGIYFLKATQDGSCKVMRFSIQH